MREIYKGKAFRSLLFLGYLCLGAVMERVCANDFKEKCCGGREPHIRRVVGNYLQPLSRSVMGGRKHRVSAFLIYVCLLGALAGSSTLDVVQY